MASKRSVPTADTAPTPTDDFKLINDISWKMEGRIHRAGITSYAQLAALTPAEIAGRLGNPSGLKERINRENWVGQALEMAELAQQSGQGTEKQSEERLEKLAEKQTDALPGSPVESDQRYENFTASLLLNADNQVLHMRLMHVPSLEEEGWDGWDERRLTNFFVQQAGLHIAAEATPLESKLEPVEVQLVAPDSQTNLAPAAVAVEVKAEVKAEAKAMSSEEVFTRADEIRARARSAKLPAAAFSNKPQATSSATASMPVNLESVLSGSRLEVLAGESDQPSRVLHHDQPFCVRLLLDLANLAEKAGHPIAYTAIVQARNLSGSRSHTAYQRRGKITPGESAILDVNGISLVPGAYRLAASVTLRPNDGTELAAPHQDFQIEGGVLQVY